MIFVLYVGKSYRFDFRVAPTYVVGVKEQFFFFLALKAEGTEKKKLWNNFTSEVLKADLDENGRESGEYHFHDKIGNPLLKTLV